MGVSPLSPAAVFERRVRAVVRGILRLHPKLTYETAMARARLVPPKRLPRAIKGLHSQYAIRCLKQRKGEVM